MKLFKCHATMPLVGYERTHIVKTYVVVASTWQEARARVRGQEPGTEFVTVPVEIPSVLMVDVKSMSGREIAELRVACEWNESRIDGGQGVHPRRGQLDDTRE